MAALGLGLGLPFRRAAPGGAAAFDWSQFFGVSDDGFVFDGTASRFYTDSAMTTEASASGTDPVGAIEDLSGKGNHAKQSTSAQKPVFYENGGIKSFYVGSVGGNNKTIIPGSGLYSSESLTIICVWEWISSGSNGTYMLSNYAGSWAGGNYFYLRQGEGVLAFNANANLVPTSVPSSIGDKLIAVAKRTGTGTNQSVLTTYGLGGVQANTATGTEETTSQGPMRIGAFVNSAGTEKIAFLMYINRAITESEHSSIIGELVNKFSGWTP